MSRAVTASLWSFAANWGQQLFSAGIFLYLAYLLTPTDFGLVAMAAAVVDLLTVIGRFGQVEALLQRARDNNPHEAESTSFWLVLAIGLLLSILLFCAGLFADVIYGDDRIRIILWVLVPIPTVQSLALVHEYFARRNFQYGAIGARNIAATLAGGMFAVVLAVMGMGYYALVIQKLVFTVVSAFTLMAYQPWRPKAVFRPHIARHLIISGMNISLSNIVSMANGRIVDLFVGHFLGFAALGTLRIAWRLFDLMLQFIIQPITNVSISSFTAAGGTSAGLRKQVVIYTGILAAVSFPLLVIGGLGAGDAITFVVGDKWLKSTDVLRILCFSFLALPVNYLANPILISINKSHMLRNQAVFQLIFTTITAYLSAQYSLEFVIIMHVVRVYVFWIYYLYIYETVVRVSVKKILQEIAGPLLMSICCACVMLAGGSILPAVRQHVVLYALGICFVLGLYAFGLWLGEHLRLWPGQISQSLTLLRRKLGKLTNDV